MSKVVGIDLGTTLSAIAIVNEHGKAEIIPNREGEQITPSVVLFDDEMPIVGSIAKRSASASPLNVVQFVKRQMGNSSWKFCAENGVEYKPEEISAIILKRLKEDAEAALGEDIRDAVITVPAYFDDAQRKATQDAGRIAGLNVLHIINEPTAAALAYGIEKLQQPQTIMVYDLGGGTFDVTIMRVARESIEVLATGGDRNLGGFDWDNEVMKFLNTEFKKRGGPDLFDDPALEQDLRDKAEIAKKTLSRNDKTNVFISGGGKNASIPLTLEQFNALTDALLRRTRSIMEMVLEDAGLTWSQVDKTLLVGGSTRMRAVPALIERVTGKRPSIELHPDEVVAMGAALRGVLQAMQEGRVDPRTVKQLPQVKVKDVNSHSMGIVTVDRYDRSHKLNSIVLKKDTSLPCKVSGHFETVEDKQAALRLQVTEGEDTELDYAVKIVGEAMIAIPPYPQGAPLEVFFEYDEDGIIHVTVFDHTAHRQLGELQLKRTSNLNEREVQVLQNKLRTLAIN